MLREVLTDLANALREQGAIDEREAFKRYKAMRRQEREYVPAPSPSPTRAIA